MLEQGTIEAFRLQAEWCEKFNSPLYAALLADCAADIERGGVVARVLDGWQGAPMPDALPLRLLGAAHRLALDGEAPELARFYPSCGGRPAGPAMGEALLQVVAAHAPTIRAALARQVQTNEVNRSAALLGGFLRAASATARPLRLLEIGSSAGLNLGWDRYRYEMLLRDGAAPDAPRRAQSVWGDAAAAVCLRAEWDGPLDVFAARATVAERAGCDLAPIDVTDAAQVRVLESFVWPDHLERLAQLRAAVRALQHDPPRLTRRRAAEWLAAEATPRPGVTTVVFHSIMWWYLSAEERDAVEAHMAAAGARATADAPLAWLRMELMSARDPEVRLRLWPPGEDHLLAHADAHGKRITWRA